MLKKKIRITPLDVLILLALSGCVIYVVYQVKVKLNYNWQWGIIPQYLFRFDEESGKWVSNYLIHGLMTTLRLSFWGTLLATLLGTVMGLLRVSKSLFHRMIARSYVELMRNLPPLVIIFIFYFFISDQIMPVLGIDRFARTNDRVPPAGQFPPKLPAPDLCLGVPSRGMCIPGKRMQHQNDVVSCRR